MKPSEGGKRARESGDSNDDLSEGNSNGGAEIDDGIDPQEPTREHAYPWGNGVRAKKRHGGEGDDDRQDDESKGCCRIGAWTKPPWRSTNCSR